MIRLWVHHPALYVLFWHITIVQNVHVFCWTSPVADWISLRSETVYSKMHHKVYVDGSMYRSISIIVQRDATQSSLFILRVHCTCFGRQPHPSSGVRKTVTTASGTVQLPPSNMASPNLATLEGGSCTKKVTGTRGCSYSFVYSWWLVWLMPETCRMNPQSNK